MYSKPNLFLAEVHIEIKLSHSLTLIKLARTYPIFLIRKPSAGAIKIFITKKNLMHERNKV